MTNPITPVTENMQFVIKNKNKNKVFTIYNPSSFFAEAGQGRDQHKCEHI